MNFGQKEHLVKPIIVQPPLRGEWNVLNTPGDRVPSHGTTEWGMTYAFDFIRLVRKQNGTVAWHGKSLIKYFLGQVQLSDSFSWGEPIYSPISGIVRDVVDFVPERRRLHLISDIGLALLNSVFFSYKRGKVQKLSGNYIIIEGENCCAFIAHVRADSIRCKVGDSVNAGEHIAELGHSGNSTAPHLHFQLMDRVDIKSAKGLPCCFTSYDLRVDDRWEQIERGVPSSKFTVRFA